MRNVIPIILVFLAIATVNVFAQEATFSYDNRNKKLHITLGVEISDPSQLQPLTVKLFEVISQEDKILVESKNIIPKDIGGDKIGLVFDLANSLIPGKKYKVEIFSNGIIWVSIKVDTGLTATFLEKDDLNCKGGIPMVFDGRASDSAGPDLNNNGIDDATEAFWMDILNYLKAENLRKNMTVETSMGEAEVLQLESAQLRKDIPDNDRLRRAALAGKVTLCLNPINAPATGVFNIRVKFKNAPLSLSNEFIGEELSWSGATQIESSDALPDAPAARKIEKNLDLGLSFSSEVKKDEETNVKNRETVGILDVRLAPWLNLIKYKPGETVLKKWTPIYLNANVSTGKITESTLSLNRVIIGTEWEYRFVPGLSLENKKPNQGNFIDYYRLKLGGKHLSDRDFKQKEIAAEIEFQPVWAFLNKPRSARWFLFDDEITGNKVVGYKTFGWEIIPKIGFQFGKTYSRRNPAEAIEATDLIKRLYGGIEMNFDVTSRFTLKLENTLYGRYELNSDRLKNYFKGEIYMRFGNPWRETSNGFFFSYEKGDAPPFTSTVNAFKFGYRIQSSGWNRFN